MQNQLVTAYKGHAECSSALAVDPGIEDCFTLYTMSCYASSNEHVQIQHALDRGVTRPSGRRQEVHAILVKELWNAEPAEEAIAFFEGGK